MGALPEKHTGRAVKLRYDNTLGAIDHERALFGHVWNRAEIYVLNCGVEVLMVGIRAIQLQLSLQRHTVGEPSFKTLIDRIARRVDIIIEKLQYEIVAGVGNWEILREHLI